MFDLEIKIDYTEVDRAMSGLLRAMSLRAIHSLAARTALKQVKSKYERRFSEQVDETSLWQSTKKMVSAALPEGPAPGFLTGTTFNSITAEATSGEGRIYPKGKWPQGSGRAWLDELGVGFKWCDNSDWGVEAHLGGAEPKYFKSSPDMTRIKYGAASTSGKIDWLYLDNEDVDRVISNLERYFDCVLSKNYAGIKAVFDDTKYDGRPTEVEEPEAVIEEIKSAQTDPRVKRIETYLGMPIEEVFMVYAAKSVEELITKLFSKIETSKSVFERPNKYKDEE